MVRINIEINIYSQGFSSDFNQQSFLSLSRDSGPGRRRADRVRRAGRRQDVRGGPGDHSEHEQGGRLALQQSQEADIR